LSGLPGSLSAKPVVWGLMDAFVNILKRVEQKKIDYAKYGFKELEMAALNTFFDLAQEYDGLENLYLVSVTVPKVFLGVESTLYVTDPKTEAIRAVADSKSGFGRLREETPFFIRIADAPYRHDRSYIVPIRGKRTPASQIFFHGSTDIIGIFEVLAEQPLTDEDLFFVQKYVNRVGYNLYNKLLTEQNIQHLKFINNLVADIEHNVMVPNLQYQHYFKKSRQYLNVNKEMEQDLENALDEAKVKDPSLYAKLSGLAESMVVANRAMFRDQEKIERHYKHTSLFLETLFRRDHFLFGQYVLRKTPCFIWKDIILPQLERYADRFSYEGIATDHIIAHAAKTKDLEIKADKGLMAQVLANLFSNAAKYAESVENGSGKKEKRVDCDAVFVEDFFGQGYHGVRVQVFSTGPPIGRRNSERVFDEGFRLTERQAVEGKGHGLHFVKNVVEVHGGIVGHKPETSGNQFYFVIPA
jgi:signal transduction histidine kinase